MRVYEYKMFSGENTYNYNDRNQMGTSLPLIITGDNNPIPTPGKSYWTQIGTDIDGETAFDESG